MRIEGYISLATLAAILGLYGRIYLMNFQFKLMWRDYCKRHGIPYNGQDVARTVKMEGD